MKRMEFRIKDVQLDHSEGRKIGGYVNVTERESETLFSQQRGKWFKEIMKKGVFERALNKNQSIPCLLEHNWDKELAHTAKGTLELREDNIGLRFDAIIEDEEVYEQIRNNEINSCSFGFIVEKQDFEDINTRCEKRYVHEINLKEISLVKNPAYVGSLVESRNLEMALKEDEEKELELSEEERKKPEVKDAEKKEKEETKPAEDTKEKEETDNKEKPEVDKEKSKEGTKEGAKKDSAENKEDVAKEGKEDGKNKENPKEDTKEEVKEEDKSKKDKEKRNLEETVVEESNVDKEIVEKLVEDAIEVKEQQIEMHEDMQECAEEYAEELNGRVEQIKQESILHGAQALRLRVEVLKLKQMKNRL